MPDFTSLLTAIKDGVATLAVETLQEHRKAAMADAEEFLRRTQGDLERWARDLATGSLTPADFEFLVNAKKDLAEMEALKQAGLALVRVDRFRNALVDLVIGTTIRMFPKL